MRAAQEAGAQLVAGEVTGLSRDHVGGVRGVTVDDAEIAAARVVLAMGPWSIRAAGWLDPPVVHAVKGHSLVFSAANVPAEALFLEHRDADGHAASPEIFPRADGTVYVCAISSESSLPDDPAETVGDAGAMSGWSRSATRSRPPTRRTGWWRTRPAIDPSRATACR